MSETKKNITICHLKIVSFTAMKNCRILHRHVIVMSFSDSVCEVTRVVADELIECTVAAEPSNSASNFQGMISIFAVFPLIKLFGQSHDLSVCFC